MQIFTLAIRKPMSMVVPLRYRNTLLRAAICNWVDLCINWTSLFTARLISDFVIVKHWREPMIFLNSSASTEVDPSNKLKDVEVVIGVLAASAPVMFVLSSMSLMYLCWEIIYPFESFINSMPRKKFQISQIS